MVAVMRVDECSAIFAFQVVWMIVLTPANGSYAWEGGLLLSRRANFLLVS